MTRKRESKVVCELVGEMILRLSSFHLLPDGQMWGNLKESVSTEHDIDRDTLPRPPPPPNHLSSPPGGCRLSSPPAPHIHPPQPRLPKVSLPFAPTRPYSAGPTSSTLDSAPPSQQSHRGGGGAEKWRKEWEITSDHRTICFSAILCHQNYNTFTTNYYGCPFENKFNSKYAYEDHIKSKIETNKNVEFGNVNQAKQCKKIHITT